MKHMITTNEHVPPATRFVTLQGTFPMKLGGALRDVNIAYETWGRRSEAGDNVILILTGLSPSAHAAASEEDPSDGWWQGMIGPGLPIDTDRWHVICINSLGSCKGSTGPASINPATGAPYRLTFPDLSIEDIADAAAAALRALGIDRLACVIGASMGGMSSLAFMHRHPDFTRNYVNVSGAAYAPPFAIAVRALQREMIYRDPMWQNGEYSDTEYPRQGMMAARKLGMITYRSAEEWVDRFSRQKTSADNPFRNNHPFGLEFEVESYLEAHARRFIQAYDPNCYLYLSRSMDRFSLADAAPDGMQDALAALSVKRALVLGTNTDILFPLDLQKNVADGLRAGGAAVHFEDMKSLQGHDAFLTDVPLFGRPISQFMTALSSRCNGDRP